MKKLSYLFGLLAVLLSDVMCAVVAYTYCALLLGDRYAGYGAPASTAFLYGIPFGVAIMISVGLALAFRKKAANERKTTSGLSK